VAKTCPSCGYSPIGPFTDNCPICAEPVRNVRSDTAGAGRPWLRWALGAAAVVVLGVAGCCGLGMWRMGTAINDARKAMEQAQADAEAERKARTVVVTAAALLKEFQDGPTAADRKYRGKLLEVTGTLERRGKSGGGGYFVILHAGDEQAPIKIECYFHFLDTEDDVENKRLGKGRTVTVRGEYAGRVSHLQLRGCVLVR
jgi:hypothetical protein